MIFLNYKIVSKSVEYPRLQLFINRLLLSLLLIVKCYISFYCYLVKIKIM